MPNRNSSTNGTVTAVRGGFRQRYDETETRREELIARLNSLGDRALKLLNETFRRSKLAQRLSVLQAAAWLIDLLERLALTL